MGECTPVIVQCYSLSEPTLSTDSHINKRHKTGPSHTLIRGTPWFPERHSNCLSRQPSPRSHRSASGMQDGQDGPLYYSSIPRPRKDTNAYNYSLNAQPQTVINDASHVDVDDNEKQNYTTSMLPPSHVHKKYMSPLNGRGVNFPPGSRTNRYETNATQASPFSSNKESPEPMNTSVTFSQPRITHIPNGFQRRHSSVDGHGHLESAPMISCNLPNRQVPCARRPTVKIHDYYEERSILVGKVYQNIPFSVAVAESEQNSNISYPGERQQYREDHRHERLASTEVYERQACEDGPFQIKVHQQDIVVGSKKRKSRQPRPQRVKSDDVSQFARSEDNQKVQHQNDCPDEPFNDRYHGQTIPSNLQDTPVPKEACREIEEDMEAPNEKNEMRSREGVQATAPVNVFDNTPSMSRIFRRENPSVNLPPGHYSSEGRRTSERCDHFYARGPLRDGPWCESNGSSHHPTNHISLEYQMNSPRQSKTAEKITENSHGNMGKHPNNKHPERNAAPQHWHVPAWMITREKHLKALEKGGPGYDIENGRCSPGTPVTISGPSQHHKPEESSRTSPHEMNSESFWNGSAERQEDNLPYHTVEAKDTPSSRNFNSPPSSLPCANGNVSSTTVDDCDELNETHRPLYSDQAYASTNDIQYSPTKQQNVTFSENHNHFLQTQEVFGNYMDPTVKERKFLCRYCGKKFAHFSTLQNHLRTHTGDKPFQCKFCNRKFAQSGVLKAHLRTHTGDKPFVCMYCRKTFAQSTTLTNHLRTHTGQKPYVCNFCGKSFSQPSTLRKHDLSHTKERPYPCKFCGKAFAQQSTLTNHLRSHTGQRPYKCHFCEKSFAQLSTLDRHLRLHSTVSLKPHQCQYCAKSFSYYSNLVSHMQVHQKEQNLVSQ